MKIRMAAMLVSSVLQATGCNSGTSGQASQDDPANPGGPTVNTDLLNADNANAVILQAFEVFSGRAYDERLTVFPYAEIARAGDGISNDIIQLEQYEARDCDNEGELSQVISNTQNTYASDSTYRNCQIGSDTINGRAVLSAVNACCRDYRHEFSDNFTVTFAPVGSMQVSGSWQYEEGFPNSLAVENFNYYFTYDGGTLRVSDANTQRGSRISAASDENGPHSYIAGKFDMQPPVLNGSTVSVDIEQDFANTDNLSQLAYQTGRMVISGGSNRIVVNADNADENSVELIIIASDGSSTSSTQSWSNWQSALAFKLPSITELQLQPKPDGDGHLVTANSYKPVLSEIFRVFSGQRLARDMLALPGYPYPAFPFAEFAGGMTGYGEAVVQTCDGGGIATLAPYQYGARQITYGWNSIFENCIHNNRNFTGNYTALDFGNHVNRSTGLTISEPSGVINFSGTIDYKNNSNRDGGPPRHFNLDNVYFESTYTDNEFSLSAANISYGYTLPWSAYLQGGFTLRSQATGQSAVAVTVGDVLHRRVSEPSPDDPPLSEFTRGVMLVDAGNGNHLRLDAANGNDRTFTLTITQAGKEPVSVVENWSDWQDDIEFNYDLDSMAPAILD